jgi:tetratricopeptide (TPR) repeat protein
VLELDENFHLAQLYLSQAYVQLGEIERALACAERAYSLAPWARAGAGHLAGLLELTGHEGRARTVLETLGDGTACAAPVGFVYYHLVGSRIEQAADWAEKAIEQREPLAVFLALLPLALELRRSSRWPQLAKMMNLPQSAA